MPSTNVDGMSDASDLAGAAASPDPAVGLRAALALRRLAESLERLQVGNARRQGWSWQDIAASLEISKQAVHKRYSATAADVAPPGDVKPVASEAELVNIVDLEG
jgi:hypothetical protein